MWIREQYGFAIINSVSCVLPVIIGFDRKGNLTSGKGTAHASIHLCNHETFIFISC